MASFIGRIDLFAQETQNGFQKLLPSSGQVHFEPDLDSHQLLTLSHLILSVKTKVITSLENLILEKLVFVKIFH